MSSEEPEERLWVPGWISEWVLLIGAAIALWNDRKIEGAIFLTGSLIIEAVRRIEAERRASERAATEPTPRSKV